MTHPRLIALPLLGALLLATLTSCGGTSPDVERREALNDVVAAANAKDADALKSAVDELIALVSRQSGKDLDAAEVARIVADAKKVKGAAGVIDADLIAKAKAEADAKKAREELARLQVSQSVAASVSASVAASVSASAAAEEERRRQEASASATASPSASPTPSPEPTPSGEPDGE